MAGIGFERLVIARPSLLVGDRGPLGQPQRPGERIGLQLWHRRVDRDDSYIDQMEMDMIAFERLVSENEHALREYKEAA